MRILILALPRTGSKFVSDNVVRYINLTQPYTYRSFFGGEYYPFELYVEDNEIKISDKKIHAPLEFFKNRVETFRRYQGPLVCKVHYESLADNAPLAQALIDQFDHVVVIHRKNEFEQLLSNEISKVTGSWEKDHRQAEAKTMPPFAVDLNSWFKKIADLKKNKAIDFGPRAVHAYCEDLFEANTEEFCRQLNLPIKDFDMNSDTREFGEDKFKMVTNIDKLRMIFESSMS